MSERVKDLERDFMTPRELFKRLGIGRTLGYELASRDALPVPVLRVGSRLRFSRRAYDALATAQHARATEDAA